MTSDTQSAKDVAPYSVPFRGFGSAELGAVTGGRISMGETYLETGQTQAALSGRDIHSSKAPPASAKKALSVVDSALLCRAIEVVDCIEPADSYNATLFLTSLSGILLSLWESCSHASMFHQDVLAILENAVRSAQTSDAVTSDQLSAFREALTDLGQPQLVRSNVEVLRTRFLAVNFTPLSFMEQSESDADESGE